MAQRWREHRAGARTTTCPATVVLIGVQVLLYLACVLAPSLPMWLATGSAWAQRFEYWRPLVYGLTTTGLLQLLLNGLALYFMGRGFEARMGSWSFAVLYVLSGLGAATVLTLAGPAWTLGGSFEGILGIIAASAVLKRHEHLDIRPDIALMVLFVVMSFLGSGGLMVGWGILSSDWIGDFGSLAVGAGVGAVLAATPWQQRTRRLAVGYTALALTCLVALTLAWVLPAITTA